MKRRFQMRLQLEFLLETSRNGLLGTLETTKKSCDRNFWSRKFQRLGSPKNRDQNYYAPQTCTIWPFASRFCADVLRKVSPDAPLTAHPSRLVSSDNKSFDSEYFPACLLHAPYLWSRQFTAGFASFRSGAPLIANRTTSKDIRTPCSACVWRFLSK